MRCGRAVAVSLAMAGLLFSGCGKRKAVDEPAPEVVKKDYTRPLPPGAPALRQVQEKGRYPDFSGDFMHRLALLNAVDYSLAYMAKPSSKTKFPVQKITHERVVKSLQAFKDALNQAKDGKDFNRIVAERFEVWESVGWDGSGIVLFTGYCTPIYEASRTRTDIFKYPLYKLPPDLGKGPDGEPLGRRKADGTYEPYPTREEIEKGKLFEGKGLELVYMKDRFEAYVVHVQGSAQLKMTDGTEIQIGYAGKTDRPYVSAGEELVKDGKLDAVHKSLPTMTDYFRQHPEDLEKYLYRNPCYVFFQETTGGPFGSLGQPVTTWRTLATDKAIFPRASVCFVDTRVPVGSRDLTRSFRQFMLDQDTGGAIRSPGRADIFMGIGPNALSLAGRAQAEGRLYYLLVK